MQLAYHEARTVNARKRNQRRKEQQEEDTELVIDDSAVSLCCLEICSGCWTLRFVLWLQSSSCGFSPVQLSRLLLDRQVLEDGDEEDIYETYRWVCAPT